MANIEQRLRDDLTRFSHELKAAEETERQARIRADRLRDRIDYINSTLDPNEDEGFGIAERNLLTPLGMSSTTITKQILSEATGPLHIKIIAEKAIQRGYGAPNAILEKVIPNISSMLAKAVREPERTGFVKVARGVFGLAGRDKPAVINEVDGQFEDDEEVTQ